MACQRCKGCMVREKWIEEVTGQGPAWYCVNCGDHIDPVVTKNRHLSQELSREQLDKRLTEGLLGSHLDALFNRKPVLLGCD